MAAGKLEIKARIRSVESTKKDYKGDAAGCHQ